MIKTSISLAALALALAACSAAALPNASSPVAASAPEASPAPAAQTQPTAIAETRATPPAHSAPVPHMSERAAAPRAAPLRDATSCDVLARATANGVLIQAVAHAARSFEGEYDLVITKSGGGGSSDVMQSGPFSVAAGETVTLGSTELGADGRYRAVLVLRDASGEVCRQERRS